ncbi:MAG: glycoside hydrolase/phage tail family protein [Cognatishimia sp.]|uniref:baseplate multidomain protein megatron n=1 Tax=Cognatishimia sp. TaxID=2211648 RepID=UPI003B8BBA00
MATMLLSAAGAAIGGAVGGSVLGLSSVAIGRFAGGLLGNAIDQRLMGSGAAVETGRIDRYRITGSAEGRAITQVFGRMRIGGHVIWATQFQEVVTQTGGGKGMPSRPKVNEISYTISLAIGLCEGQISGVTRLWADGREVSQKSVTMRIYDGSEGQLPDPKMEAVEGVGTVPAYRGLAYVVFEDLDLAPYGNRIPQFSFEVSRPTPVEQPDTAFEPTRATQAVALIPGTGEYALATEPVYLEKGPGQSEPANVNAPGNQADFVTTMDALDSELPNCGAVSLITSWFGTDLRCGECEIGPRVETIATDGTMPWQVSGVSRSQAQEVPVVGDRPVYGGTPSDQSVVQAIEYLKAQGRSVMYYPFVLMEQRAGNILPDPWTGEDGQPALPWRGRITLSAAPGQEGSPDGTVAAEAEVAAFFGTASASDFVVSNRAVTYSGPPEWRYRRFILHQAALCAAAGGVDAFCIGSEMRGLTSIRGEGREFVAVTQLIDLLREVRVILGPDVKLSYAADWSEYFGYQPEDGSGDRYFHLDRLWADDDLDFVGIDNYMSLSDWRDEAGHADADHGSIYDLDYLMANIEGGEGYDWYYHSDEAREAQIRTSIEDGAYGEPWVYRYKDISNWWANAHHERINGVRQAEATAWEAQSKPIVFTELGCAAVDKGTNQPNKFLDPKSSESSLPYFSNGIPDDFIQHQYLKAQYRYWADEANNPVSEVYDGPMIDMSQAYVWAWDTRPFPRFPRNRDLWSDGDNYRAGHWISGRTTHRSLASVVREICEVAGVNRFDVSGLSGMVRGYAVDQVTSARQMLEPLMIRYGFDAVDRNGVLSFVMRDAEAALKLDEVYLGITEDLPFGIERQRMSEAEVIGRVRVQAVDAVGDFDTLAEEAILPDQETHNVSTSEFNLSMQRGEARLVAERWLAEAQLAKDTMSFALPLSQLALQVGQVIEIDDENGEAHLYRIDRMEIAEAIQCFATRVAKELYEPAMPMVTDDALCGFSSPVPVTPLFMDLPLIRGDENAHSPHVVAVADPWPGPAAVYSAFGDSGFQLNTVLSNRPIVGQLQEVLPSVQAGVWDRSAPVEVKLIHGALESQPEASVLQGGNVALIGDGTAGNWEVLQFATAELISEKTYAISDCLRGQAGSDGVQPGEWPAGSWFVLLNGAVDQMVLPLASLGLEKTYRVGPAGYPVSDPIYTEQVHQFAGNGLRPFRPVHLNAEWNASGDLLVNWIRRSRIGGDNWELPEIPLGEETESYLVEVRADGVLLHSEFAQQPELNLSHATASSWSIDGVLDLQVAQISALYGAGPFAQITIAVPA